MKERDTSTTLHNNKLMSISTAVVHESESSAVTSRHQHLQILKMYHLASAQVSLTQFAAGNQTHADRLPVPGCRFSMEWLALQGHNQLSPLMAYSIQPPRRNVDGENDTHMPDLIDDATSQNDLVGAVAVFENTAITATDSDPQINRPTCCAFEIVD